MLVEIRKLNITNDGYTRRIFLDSIYVNSSHIISIKDYEEVNEFLLKEGNTALSKRSYSIIRVHNGEKTEEIIALGSSREVFSSIQSFVKNQKGLLNG